MPKKRGPDAPPTDAGDERSYRIAGLVARVVAKAVHDAVLMDDLVKTKAGQAIIADALLEFARTLDRYHVRGIGELIDASNLARHASELLREGGL